MKKVFNEKKWALVIFLVTIFFQNFALISNESFGIAASTVVLAVFAFRYRLINRISKGFFSFVVGLFITLLITSAVNAYCNISQVLRLFMIVFDGIVSYRFIKVNSKAAGMCDFVFKALSIITIIMCLYGVYQYVAVSHHWPHFMNIFNNNTSYKPRGVFDYYGGWTSSFGRIYGVCSEPSFYASILCIDFVILWESPIRNKIINFAQIMIIVNIILTGARSGWGIFACIILSIIATTLFRRENLSIKMIQFVVVFIPIITFFFMNYLVVIANKGYSDASALSRTLSAQYYLNEVFDSINSVLFGHGLGYSWSLDLTNERYIEAVAHNGYIEIMYLLGIPFLFFLLYQINLLSKKLPDQVLRTIFLMVAVSMCMFGSDYNIESNIELFFVMFALFEVISSSEMKIKTNSIKKIVDEKDTVSVSVI